MVTPRTEQQVLPSAEAAVLEACLAEDGLGAQMLGDFGQAPERFGPISLAAPMETAPLSASPLATRGPEGHSFTQRG